MTLKPLEAIWAAACLGAPLAVCAGIGWMALGEPAVPPREPTRRIVLEQLPAVDLDAIAAAAATWPVPRTLISEATRNCRLFRRQHDCQLAAELRDQAAKTGVD